MKADMNLNKYIIRELINTNKISTIDGVVINLFQAQKFNGAAVNLRYWPIYVITNDRFTQ